MCYLLKTQMSALSFNYCQPLWHYIFHKNIKAACYSLGWGDSTGRWHIQGRRKWRDRMGDTREPQLSSVDGSPSFFQPLSTLFPSSSFECTENKVPKGINLVELEQRVGLPGEVPCISNKTKQMLLDCQGKKFLPNWKGWLLECRNPWGAFLERLEEAWLWESNSWYPHPLLQPGWRSAWVKFTRGVRAVRWASREGRSDCYTCRQGHLCVRERCGPKDDWIQQLGRIRTGVGIKPQMRPLLTQLQSQSFLSIFLIIAPLVLSTAPSMRCAQ